MVDVRTCDQCGAVFEPRREHGRFCSARCRVAWNRENAGDRGTGGSALEWSISAMRDATWRLLRAQARDRSRAFAVISEVVWWVTIVDGTLVRYHPDAYDSLLASYGAEDRARIEGTLAGLRFVRNRAGQHVDHTDFIHRGARGDGRIAAWRWTSMPEPALASLPPRGQAWEASRYRDYEAYLAGRTVEETFGRAVAFLEHAAASATLAVPFEVRRAAACEEA
jgi:hypothetical protein